MPRNTVKFKEGEEIGIDLVSESKTLIFHNSKFDLLNKPKRRKK